MNFSSQFGIKLTSLGLVFFLVLPVSSLLFLVIGLGDLELESELCLECLDLKCLLYTFDFDLDLDLDLERSLDLDRDFLTLLRLPRLDFDLESCFDFIFSVFSSSSFAHSILILFLSLILLSKLFKALLAFNGSSYSANPYLSYSKA